MRPVINIIHIKFACVYGQLTLFSLLPNVYMTSWITVMSVWLLHTSYVYVFSEFVEGYIFCCWTFFGNVNAPKKWLRNFTKNYSRDPENISYWGSSVHVERVTTTYGKKPGKDDWEWLNSKLRFLFLKKWKLQFYILALWLSVQQ